MTIIAINASSMAWVRGVDANYATAHGTCFDGASGAISIPLGQQLSAGVFYIVRGGVKFDTSVIPSTAIISRVYAKISVNNDGSTTNFDIGIGKHDWSACDPISAGNQETAYDGILSTGYDKIWRNTSGMSINTYYDSEDLDVAWINKAGNTYFSFISSRDLSATSPAGNEYVAIDFTVNVPQLVVEYTIPASLITGISSITGIQSIQF